MVFDASALSSEVFESFVSFVVNRLFQAQPSRKALGLVPWWALKWREKKWASR